MTPNSLRLQRSSKEQGKILVQDLWYEGYSARYVNLGSSNSGLFALSGTNVAPYAAAAGVNAIRVNGFNGVATFLGNRLDLAATVLASGSNANMKMAFIGSSNITTNTSWFVNNATAAEVGFLHNARTNPGGGSSIVANQGSRSPNFIRSALQFIRSVRPDDLTGNGPGVTDVRLFNLRIESVAVGIHARGQ